MVPHAGRNGGSVQRFVAVVAVGLVMMAGMAYDGGHIVAAQATVRGLAASAARAQEGRSPFVFAWRNPVALAFGGTALACWRATMCAVLQRARLPQSTALRVVIIGLLLLAVVFCGLHVGSDQHAVNVADTGQSLVVALAVTLALVLTLLSVIGATNAIAARWASGLPPPSRSWYCLGASSASTSRFESRASFFAPIRI